MMSPDTQTHLRIQTHIVHVPLFLSTYQISGEINALLNFPFTDVNNPTMAVVYIQSTIDLLVNAHGISPSLVPGFFVPFSQSPYKLQMHILMQIARLSSLAAATTPKKSIQERRKHKRNHKHTHLETVSHTQERTHTTNNIPMTLQFF